MRLESGCVQSGKVEAGHCWKVAQVEQVERVENARLPLSTDLPRAFPVGMHLLLTRQPCPKEERSVPNFKSRDL